jgi:hypothetical protein
MSFDIFFQSCRFGATVVEKESPFTGDTGPVFPIEPLTAAELGAVQAVLTKATTHGPDEFGCHVVGFEDGGGAEVFADSLETGCMVAVRRITPGLLQFLIDLLKAGNWGMIAAMEDSVFVVTSMESAKGVPDDFPEIVVCNSADELGVLLSRDFATWKKYRDQIVGDGGSPT